MKISKAHLKEKKRNLLQYIKWGKYIQFYDSVFDKKEKKMSGWVYVKSPL